MKRYLKSPSRHRGMTLVELTVGMAISSIVLTALASITYAVAYNWRRSEPISAQAAGNMAATRLRSILRECELTGAVIPGDIGLNTAASLLLWRSDSNADGKIQLSELLLLDYSPEDWVLYSASVPKGEVDPEWEFSVVNSEVGLTLFRRLATRQPVIGRLEGARFFVADAATTRRPIVEFQLLLKVEDTAVRQWGTATLRGPANRPTE